MDELIATEDGSLTLRDRTTGELQHNRAGAYTEALKHYVEAGGVLERLEKRGRITVLDACFGLGYNSLVLIQEALKRKCRGEIEIHAVEIDKSVIRHLPLILRSSCFSTLLNVFAPSECIETSDFRFEHGDLRVRLMLKLDCLQNFLCDFDSNCDYVFHDPYSPARVPELWTLEIFRSYKRVLEERNGCLLTYSSAYAVRGGMLEAGFEVMRTPPLGAKSGGTLGLLRPGLIDHNVMASDLEADTRERLHGPSGIPYSGGAGESRKDILDRRQAAQRQAIGD